MPGRNSERTLNVSPDDGIQLAAGSGQLIQTHCVPIDIETITLSNWRPECPEVTCLKESKQLRTLHQEHLVYQVCLLRLVTNHGI